MIEGLKQRVITAVMLLLALIAVTVLLPPFYFAVFMAVIVLAASWEWSGLIGVVAARSRLFYQLTVLLMLLGGFVLLDVRPGTGQIDFLRASMVLLLGLLWWSLGFLIILAYPRNSVLWNDPSRIGLMGLLALLPTWVGVILLKYMSPQGYFVLSLVLLVAAVDVGAYFVGSRFGKRKLAPQLSPNKSWEGVWGGLLTCMLLALLLSWLLHSQLRPLAAWQFLSLMLLSIAVTGFGVVGDLLESMLKRNSQVKDSGQLLPGHGGLLDRVDGLLAATPVYVLTLLFTLYELE